MTGDERQRLRAAVDRAVREQRPIVGPICGGCGGPQSSITWSCSTCRERQRAVYRRQIAEAHKQNQWLRQHNDHLQRLLDQRDETIRRLRADRTVGKYDSEEERLEARRATWRESKRRAAEKKAAA